MFTTSNYFLVNQYLTIILSFIVNKHNAFACVVLVFILETDATKMVSFADAFLRLNVEM